MGCLDIRLDREIGERIVCSDKDRGVFVRCAEFPDTGINGNRLPRVGVDIEPPDEWGRIPNPPCCA